MLFGMTPQANAKRGYAPISPEQMDYLRMYCDSTRAQNDGKISVRDYFRALSDPVQADCESLAVDYSDLKAAYEYRAEEAVAVGDEMAGNKLRAAAKVYGDFADAAANLAKACESNSRQEKNKAMSRFLAVERFVLQNKMECLGRKWLTTAECEGILSKFGPPPRAPQK